MKIPYGISNFADLRRDRYFYIDKTPFIPKLEPDELGASYSLFLRPRRFGKSTLLSMLEHYYDLDRKDQFDELFSGLWIHEHPTPERNRYLVLSLDFSKVSADAGGDTLKESFDSVVQSGVRMMLMTYRERFPDLAKLEARMSGHSDANSLIGDLLAVVWGIRQKIYLLIDEYDNFANRLLSSGRQDLYESVVGAAGFIRTFYASLKAGTTSGSLGRMLITGVSPILLDDLSSGFNIITHISMDPRLNTLAGFSRAEAELAVDTLLQDKPHLKADPRLCDREQLLSVLERYYNGYCFAEGVAERVYNADLVLYFLRELKLKGVYPANMLDMNVRTDYGRLQRIATLAGAAGKETRALLETILSEGGIESRLVEQFGVRTMNAPAQLISLFYYMGMLTFGPRSPTSAQPNLVIPNLVIRELQWEYLALALKDQEQIWLNTQELQRALEAMAVEGNINPLLMLFQEQVVGRIGNKDLRQFNEKVLKLMLLAYISQSRVFNMLSEKEFGGGYCDLFLGVNTEIQLARYAWMLEVKYLKTQAKANEIEAAFEQALSQLDRYGGDQKLISLLTLGKELKAGALVFVGAKTVLFRPWPREAVVPTKKSGAKKKPIAKTAKKRSVGMKRKA